MSRNLELKGDGWARGRNGYFVPRDIYLFKDVEGKLNLSVSSSRAGKSAPISLTLTQEDALELAQEIFAHYQNTQKTRLVVVIEGGNVQEIMANRPGVEVVKVDYDTNGCDTKETKRVLQFGDGGKKSFEKAFVTKWGEASPEPKEIDRFFRNAV